MTVAIAKGLSSDKVKSILNLFLIILLTIILVLPINFMLGFPLLLFCTIISLRLIPFEIPVPIAFEKASFAANLLA